MGGWGGTLPLFGIDRKRRKIKNYFKKQILEPSSAYKIILDIEQEEHLTSYNPSFGTLFFSIIMFSKFIRYMAHTSYVASFGTRIFKN